jgi:hypothetical protein
MCAVGPLLNKKKAKCSSVSIVGMRIIWLDILVFLGILIVAIARLPTPFGGDQALNLLFGQVIYHGGSPYRDLWDLKHLGVFFFFATGGGLFHFNEIGIHLFEMLWMLILALMVRVAAGRWLEHRTMASLAPALTVGLYYAVAGERYLTQTEAVVGLPVLASLWCSVEGVRSEHHRKLWLAASGFAAAVVLVFKILYVAIPTVFWLLAIRELNLRRRESLRRTVADVTPWLLAGALLPVVATLSFVVQKGVAALAFWTYFQHPAEVWSVVPMEPRRLARAIRSFVLSFAPALALAGLGAGDAVLFRRLDLMAAGLCAWVLIGLLLIAMQVISWWDYHFLLLLVPIGMLAARGVETLNRVLTAWLEPARLRLGRIVLALGLVVLFVPQLRSATRVTSDVLRGRPLPFSETGVAAYHAEHYPGYASIATRTAFLRDPRSHPGPIYVIDTPTYYVHARRPPAVPLLAPWFHPTDRLWKRLVEELVEASPPYVRVSDWALEAIVDVRPSLRDDVAGLVALIKTRYDILSRDEAGTWYIRRDLASRR